MRVGEQGRCAGEGRPGGKEKVHKIFVQCWYWNSWCFTSIALCICFGMCCLFTCIYIHVVYGIWYICIGRGTLYPLEKGVVWQCPGLAFNNI